MSFQTYLKTTSQSVKPVRPKKQERLLTIRFPRNGGSGYVIMGYEGRQRRAWHYCTTRNYVEVGRLIHNALKHGELPSESTILWNDKD